MFRLVLITALLGGSIGCGEAEVFSPWSEGGKAEAEVSRDCSTFTGVCSKFCSPMSHGETIEKLTSFEPWALKALFECDLPKLGEGIDSRRYLELMQTAAKGVEAPYYFDWSHYADASLLSVTSQYWDVHWAFGFDAHDVYKELRTNLGLLAPFFEQLFNGLTFIKKEFPKQDTSDQQLSGHTSFGYSNAHAHANPTPNTIHRRKTADGIPILLMSYSEKPWYLPIRLGFVDYFRFLTSDIIIAKGNYGQYDRNDPRADSGFLSPDALQFWMERKDETVRIDLRQEPTYLSVPMMRTLWKSASTANNELLRGRRWSVDLVLSSEIAPVASVEEATRWASSVELRRVQPRIDVFVLRSCAAVSSPHEALKRQLPGTEQLPMLFSDLHVSQYLEDQGRSYCAYYLLQTAGP